MTCGIIFWISIQYRRQQTENPNKLKGNLLITDTFVKELLVLKS